MNGYFPVVLKLRGKRCVVVGGGTVAQRKLLALLEAGADDVLVISPAVTPRIEQLALAGSICLERREYMMEDARGAWLLFAAADDHIVNESVAADGERMGILVNTADDYKRGSFISPATVRRGDLLLAVTASGASPTLSIQIKRELEERYGPEYEEIAACLRRLRELATERGLDERHKLKVLRLAADEAVRRDNRHQDIEGWLESLILQIDRRDS